MTAEFWKIIFERHSIRRYLNQSVSLSILEKIIRTAARAPSAHNNQPWHFVVITSPEIKDQLAQKIAARYDQYMTAQGIPCYTRKKRIQSSITHFKDVPVIIIPFLVNKLRDKKRSESNEKLEVVMDIQSVAVAAGNLLLAATASGLGACWYAGPLFCSKIVTSCLHVDDAWRPQALITLGYPDEIPRPKEKKPSKEIMSCV